MEDIFTPEERERGRIFSRAILRRKLFASVIGLGTIGALAYALPRSPYREIVEIPDSVAAGAVIAYAMGLTASLIAELVTLPFLRSQSRVGSMFGLL